MIADLPKGLTARPLTWDDRDAVFKLEAASEDFDDGQPEIALTDVEAAWSRPDFDLATMSIGIFERERLVGYAEVFESRAEAVVAPTHRGLGIGSALVPWTWATARAHGRAEVGQTISDAEDGARALLADHGYRSAHTSWLLRIELDEEPAPPRPPDGVAFRPLRPGVDDHEMFDVIEAAFSTWNDRTPNTFENWLPQMLRRPEVLPELQVIATSRGRIVGVALNFGYREDDEGWVQQLAVEDAFRGRGLGRALLQESFRRFYAIGRRACGLSTDSRTRALGLYEHVGMHVRKSYTHWEKVF